MFKDLGIKGRVLLLTLLPTSLLAMVLGGYFTWVQLSDMRAQLIERGQLIAEQLAPLAATALARKDTAVLNRIANEALDQPDVRAVTFLDARQERLAHAGPSMLTVAPAGDASHLSMSTELDPRTSCYRFLAATTACPAPPSLTTSAYSAGSNWNCRTTGLCCADIAACSPASC